MLADFTTFESLIASVPLLEAKNFSEADTRAYMIDPVLSLLGYTAFGDIRREVAVPATKEFLDYELRIDGKPWAIVEAKAVRHSIADAAAAQCVQYASVPGHRWCIITNGFVWAFYDAHHIGDLSSKKVAEVNVANAASAWNVIRLMAKDAVVSGSGLESLLEQRIVERELRNPASATLAAMRRVLSKELNRSVTPEACADVVARFLSTPHALPADLPVQPSATEALSTAIPASSDAEEVDEGGGARRVRLSHLAAAGFIHEGDTLSCIAKGLTVQATVLAGGVLQCGGKTVTNIYEALRVVGAPLSGGSEDKWRRWTTANGESLWSVRARYIEYVESET